MPLHRFLFAVVLAALAAAAAQADERWQKLRLNGAEAYYADLDLRAALAKEDPAAPPEAKRKVPPATAAAFDWSALVKSRIHAQGESINCWCFASVAALEYNWAIRNGGAAPALAVQPILDRTGKNGGTYAGVALQDLLEHGTCATTAYPHVGTPGKLNEKVKTPYRAVAWGLVSLPGGVLPSTAVLKQALVDHGPLVANVYTTPAFEGHKGGPFRGDANPPPDSPTNHILLIVGWDDARGRAGCWKVQNSWGGRWCEKGFIWVEYGTSNIGHSACWIRAQSTQYALPADVHKQICPAADPFQVWPSARKLKAAPPDLPTLTPADALKRQGERVVVEFKVRGGDVHSTDGHVELFSEATWRDEKCLIVRILKSELGNFPAKSDRELLQSYAGKTVRVRGSVQMNPIGPAGRRIIELADPAQIERTD